LQQFMHMVNKGRNHFFLISDFYKCTDLSRPGFSVSESAYVARE